MKNINISTPKHLNTFALVDDEDYEYLNQWKWHYCTKNEKGISVQRTYNRKSILIHRIIMNCPKDLVIDHKNRL